MNARLGCGLFQVKRFGLTQPSLCAAWFGGAAAFHGLPAWKRADQVGPHFVMVTCINSDHLCGTQAERKIGDDMSRLHTHPESHLVSRIGWLRAAVLGANDGIVSTASLIVGVAAASAATSEVLVAGVAGLVAGAMSMAAGEYVSVSSQSDTEQADLARERAELATQPEFEREELARIYIDRGVTPDLARQVADQLMAKDPLGAHARDELGISEVTTARPIQAALTSAATFAVGAAMPLAMVLLMPNEAVVMGVSIASLVFLALLGTIGARAGGAKVMKATLRVTFWGALAMALTAGIGALFGTVV
jgi:VIT1/CCC1 family predicted Fe2+/Mn2+ transporter